jgi:gliding motility-associated-like protein
MKNTSFFIAFLILAAIPRFAQSQCYIFANGYPATICAGEAVTLTATGDCGYLMANDFNNGTPGVGWVATTGVDFTNPCGPGPDGIYLWMGNQTPIPRTLTTVPFNVTGVCEISFWLRFAVQTGSSGTNCEGPDLAGEGVSVQYSTNNGVTWTDIVYFRPDGVQCPSYPNTVGFTNVGANQQTPFTTWAQYTFPIPPSAQTPNTRFQFKQHSYSGQFFDHWGVDMVEITCPSDGVVFQWSHGDTSLTSVVYPTTDSMFVITVTDTLYGQGSVSDTVWVTVKPVPTATFDVESPICSDLFTNITYTGNGDPTATYNWGFSGGQVLSGSGSGPYQVTWPLDGWQYLSLDVIQDGCSSPQTHYDSVLVNLAPTTVFMGSPTQGCMPVTVQFTDLSSLGANWYWNFGDGATSTQQNPVHTYNTPGEYTVGLIVVTDSSCDDTLVIQNYIKVYGQPVADFTYSPSIGKVYDPTFMFDADYTYASSVYWNFGDGTESYSFPPVSHTFPGVEGTYTVTFILTNQHGCSDTITKVIQIIDDILEFPNVITPNGDGKNDHLVITNGDKYPNNLLVVFNRWGKKIYEMENYDNKWNGADHPDGTYFYIFRYADKEHSGTLTILRGM